MEGPATCKSAPEEFSYVRAQDMTSRRFSGNGLLERTLRGSPQDLLTRPCTGSREGSLRGIYPDFRKIFVQGFVQDHTWYGAGTGPCEKILW